MLETFRNIFAAPRDLILVVAALWIGLWLAEKRSSRYGIPVSDLNNLAFFPLIGYLLGGRILFALQNLSAFVENPVSLISLNLDLFDPLGAGVVAILTAWAYGYRKNLPIWSALDALTPLFAVFAIGFGLAHLASGSAFGKETTLPWGMDLWGAVRHPSQVYETIAALLTFGLLLVQKGTLRPGIHFLTFSALTSGYRVFLETFRGDSTLLSSGLRLEQILAWAILAVTLFYLERTLSRPLEEADSQSNG